MLLLNGIEINKPFTVQFFLDHNDSLLTVFSELN